MRKALLGLITLLLISSSTPTFAARTEPKKAGGITISPAFQEITLAKDKNTLSGSFAIANKADVVETFELSTVDMGALDETGGVVFSGLPQDYQQKYGLAKWVTLSQTNLTVPPRSVGKVTFTIKNEDSLTPGGHYGAIIVRRSGSPVRANQPIDLSPQAASLLFLRKVGGEVYDLSLSRITSNHSVWRLPTKVHLPFRNDGNIHVVPRGVVRLKDALGREIAKGIINPESALILPERTRTLSVNLDSQARTIWPGRYSLEVEYRYDGQAELIHLRQTFFTANLRVLLLLSAAIVLLAIAIYNIWKHKTWRHILRRPKFHRRKWRR